MAEAKFEQVTKTIIESEKVVLELSVDEAQVIYALTSFVSGSVDYSPRKHASKVREALNEALKHRNKNPDADGYVSSRSEDHWAQPTYGFFSGNIHAREYQEGF